MEVKAVEAAVIQKVRDALNEEKMIANHLVMIRQLKRVQKSLKKLQRFLEGEEVLDMSQQSRDYLCILYEVEDEIERFAFLAARKKKLFGFLKNKTLLFKKPNLCRMLIRKIKKILPMISSSSEDLSATTTPEELYHKPRVLTKSSSTVWPVSTIPSSKKGRLTRSLSTIPQKKKKLTPTYSYNKHMMNKIGYKEDDSAYTREQCYDSLSIKLKLQVLYLNAFPKDYDIPVRRLLRLWLAEGFVTRNYKQPVPEDLVQKQFDNLVDLGIIQITKLRSDNTPKQCRLVSVLLDYLSPKAQDVGLFYIQNNLGNVEHAAGPFGVRRMVQQMSTAKALATSPKGRKFDPTLLRSYVSFNRQRKDTSAKEVGALLGRITKSDFCLLKVLDLEWVNNPTLPDNLDRLRLLTYLGLRRTNLNSLPESVGKLSLLETLDVKHTDITSLPDSISKLKHLRHLNLNDIRLTKPPSNSLSLITLWGLYLDERISVNEGLSMLLNLRELGIKFHLSTRTQSVLLDWIVKLVNLQSLRLRSVDGTGTGRASNLVLKPLTSLNKLTQLNLYGNLERLPAVHEFPPMVKVLTLAISKLNEDPMATLEQLPCLIVLRLFSDSFMGKRMVCQRGGFKKLEVLKIWKLMELEEWDVEEEAMEILKELDISCCSKLKNISSRLLLKPRRLEKLVVTEMPNDFVARITYRKSPHTSLRIN